MSNEELKNFVLEIISHQINETIGREEEMEAWREMSSFFGKEFEIIILEIKRKYETMDINEVLEENTQQQRLDLLEKNNSEKSKQDMWDD